MEGTPRLVPDAQMPTSYRGTARVSEDFESAEDQGISFQAVAGLVRAHRAIVLASAFGLVALVVAWGLAAGRSYTSKAVFMSHSSRPLSQMSGLAAQFGLSVPNSGGTDSPFFYVDLLHSPQILGPVVQSQFEVTRASPPVRGDLAQIYELRVTDPELRRFRAMQVLDKSIYATADVKTGLVTLRVSSRYPEIAKQLAERLLERINLFNLENRRTRATAERTFIEERLQQVGGELRAAEHRLEQFSASNREYRLSPKLSLEHDRLSRQVTMRQQVFTSLAESYEQAKIEEVRDLAVITVLALPEKPVVPDPRGLLKRSILALFGGAALGLALAYLRQRRMSAG